MHKWLIAIAAFLLATTGLSALFLWLLGPELGATCRGLTGAALDSCVAQYALAVARSSFKITAIGAAISAVATVALVITIIFTARATEAAVEASAAAKHAVELARDTMTRELRPYIIQAHPNNEYQLDNDGAIIARVVRIMWTNVGNTPALNVRARAHHILTDAALPSDFDFPDREMADGASTLGKDMNFGSPTLRLTLEEVEEVISGTKFLHVWSWVEYEGFETNRRFRSEFYAVITYYSPSGRAVADDKDLSLFVNLQDRFCGVDDTCTHPPKTPLAPRHAGR
jgi:hypothetical protein